jgi:hypothetical protein
VTAKTILTVYGNNLSRKVAGPLQLVQRNRLLKTYCNLSGSNNALANSKGLAAAG